MKNQTPPTGVEHLLGEKEIIVSKTDPTGKLIYANKKFLEISDYQEEDVLGQQHNLIRHPDMPRAIFQYLWNQISSKNEIFAYVVNLCKQGDHYWVLAHVTPSLGDNGQLLGFHSNRRASNPQIVKDVIEPLYKKLAAIEQGHSSPKSGLQASMAAFDNFISEKGGDYGRWLFSL